MFPVTSVVRHMNDQGVAYASCASVHRWTTCFAASGAEVKVAARDPVPFTGAREGMVYTLRHGRVGYYPDTGMQQEYYPTTFTMLEMSSFASLLDFCTDHLKTLQPEHKSVIEFVSNHLKRMFSAESVKCNVDVLLPGYDTWIPLDQLKQPLYQIKVTVYQKPSVRVEHIVLFPDAQVGDLVRHVEKRFQLQRNSYDLKTRDGASNMDLSDLNACLLGTLPVLSAFTLQLKDMQGKLKMRRGEMNRNHELPPPKFMTLGGLTAAARKKRSSSKHDDHDDDDDEDDDEDAEYIPPPTTSSNRSMRRINQAFDSTAITPFVEKVEDGLVSVGFVMAMSVAEAKTYWDDLFTVGGIERLDKKLKKDFSEARKTNKQHRK
jgi:hypothetical protein